MAFAYETLNGENAIEMNGKLHAETNGYKNGHKEIA